MCYNISSCAVMLKIVKLSKESGSDQVGYVISSPILQDSYLQVTEQSLGSENSEYMVKFTPPKQTKVCIAVLELSKLSSAYSNCLQ